MATIARGPDSDVVGWQTLCLYRVVTNQTIDHLDSDTTTTTTLCNHTLTNMDIDTATKPPSAPTTADLRSRGRISVADLCRKLPPAPRSKPPAPGYRFRPPRHSLQQPAPVESQPDEPQPPRRPPVTPLPLTYTTYPHLVNLVLEQADLETTLSCRLVCRSLKADVDRLLEKSTRYPEPGTHGGRFMHPRIDGLSRAMIPPYTVVDHIYLDAREVTNQLWLPLTTRRHVVVLSFNPRAPPFTAMPIWPEILSGGHLLRMPSIPSPNRRPVYPELLDLAFAPRLADAKCNSENDPSSDHESQPDLDTRWTQKVGFAWGPRPHGFFGHIVHNLAVAGHLRLGSVRLRGLETLPLGLPCESSRTKCGPVQGEDLSSGSGAGLQTLMSVWIDCLRDRTSGSNANVMV
ncbi:uncharacterized protein LOC62_01G001609 [Vanrija pseudolonga]|uniref:Uncharacterized protein n=1 Tax=Vanrija pseudolonga TaxID=143232 RepID=A0AAF1BFH2_9TREE|nr:hypothetical protein LOC62_01G001609 [Vanrija pseudolonga]